MSSHLPTIARSGKRDNRRINILKSDCDRKFAVGLGSRSARRGIAVSNRERMPRAPLFTIAAFKQGHLSVSPQLASNGPAKKRARAQRGQCSKGRM